MAVSCEVKRTLVKSPPELWSELSDPQSLARHLGGVGEVTIVRATPESEVEWEADGASGSVKLEPSGFGTKVTLFLSRDRVEPVTVEPDREPPDQAAVEGVAEPDIEPPVQSEPEEPAVEPEPEAAADAEAPATEEPTSEAETEPIPAPAAESEPVPRQSFFARIFKRHRRGVARAGSEPATLIETGSEEQAAQPEPPAAPKAEPSVVVEPEPPVPVAPEPFVPVAPEPFVPVAPEPQAVVEPEPPQQPAAPAEDVGADLARLEAEMAEQDEAMLTAVLDRLGAAHHRPFSRS